MEKKQRISKNDVYERINDQIISMLQNDIIPWTDPNRLNTEAFRSYATGAKYSLLNSLLLGKPGYYITFPAVNAQNGMINKGAKAKKIFVYKAYEKKVKKEEEANTEACDGENGEEDEQEKKTRLSWFFISYNVFSLEDVTGVKPKELEDVAKKANRPIDDVEDIVCEYLAKEKIRLKMANVTNPSYSPDEDRITMCPITSYASSLDFYKDFLYQAVRSTCRNGRCDRKLADKDAGGEYGGVCEELVCEMGSMYLMSFLGIDAVKTYKYTAHKVNNWIQNIRDHERLFADACSRAEKAAKYILEHSSFNQTPIAS